MFIVVSRKALNCMDMTLGHSVNYGKRLVLQRRLNGDLRQRSSPLEITCKGTRLRCLAWAGSTLHSFVNREYFSLLHARDFVKSWSTVYWYIEVQMHNSREEEKSLECKHMCLLWTTSTLYTWTLMTFPVLHLLAWRGFSLLTEMEIMQTNLHWHDFRRWKRKVSPWCC